MWQAVSGGSSGCMIFSGDAVRVIIAPGVRYSRVGCVRGLSCGLVAVCLTTLGVRACRLPNDSSEGLVRESELGVAH